MKSHAHNTVLLMHNPDNIRFLTIPKLFALSLTILPLFMKKSPNLLEQDETDSLRYYSSVKTEEQYAER